ncbi:hypothetical protein C0993_004843, partial [Termitomyces sp. T159_Od127]
VPGTIVFNKAHIPCGYQLSGFDILKPVPFGLVRPPADHAAFYRRDSELAPPKLFGNIGVRDGPKYSQVRDVGLPACPGFLRYDAVQSECWRAASNMDRVHERLAPVA